MFIPKYTVTNQVLKDIGSFEASKELIFSSEIIPAWQEKLRKMAKEQTLLHGMSLEGRFISEEELASVLSGNYSDEPNSDIKQAVNLNEAFKFISQLSSQSPDERSYVLSEETILNLHKIISSGLSNEESSGKFRVRQLVIRESSSGKITYSPPPAAEVPYLIEDLINWLNSPEGHDTHPVIRAAVAHLEIYRIHPFASLNVLLALLVSVLILSLDKYDLNGNLSFANFLDSSQMDYFQILQDISGQKVLDTHERDLTAWIEYFSRGVAKEALELREKVRKISGESRVKDELGERVTLNERQMIILEYLHKHGSFQNKDFRKMFPDFSDDTVLRELKFLKQKNLVKKEGGTKKATYVLT